MGRLTTFTHVSVDGCYAGANGEIDWFKDAPRDEGYEAWTHEQATSGARLVYGRTTYEMMKNWWPTLKARKADPEMANVVDESPKIVFSRTLDEEQDAPHWRNVTVVRDIAKKEVRKLKRDVDGNLTILGSGSIVQQLSNLALIDEYNIVVVPVVLGNGKRLFDDVEPKELELLEARSFDNGLTVMRFEPR